MSLFRITAAFVVGAMMLGACSSNGLRVQDLGDTEYWSTDVRQDGEPFPLVSGTRITLRFRDGTLQAGAGCNSIGGAAEIQGGELRVQDLAMTEMGCDPERHAQDDFLIAVLSNSPSVTVDGDSLSLETANASIEFIDAAIANPNRALEGTTWRIDGFLSGETASSFATDVDATIRINGDMMELFDGCIEIEIPVEVTSNEIRFAPVGMTPVDQCDAPPGYRQSIFTAMSRGALEYSINGTSMTLATPDNVGFTLKAVE